MQVGTATSVHNPNDEPMFETGDSSLIPYFCDDRGGLSKGASPTARFVLAKCISFKNCERGSSLALVLRARTIRAPCAERTG